MRKITANASNAFVANRPFSSGNTTVTVEDGITSMYLHGNLIAQNGASTGFRVRLAGWNTVTTRERINGLLQTMGFRCGFCQRNFEARWINQKGEDFAVSDTEWVVPYKSPNWTTV